MRYTSSVKRKKLKATDQIRIRYVTKPIIALYMDEADAIVDNVMSEEMIDEFYEWLEDWRKFIFKDSNFIVKPREGKDGSMYAAFKIQGRNMVVFIFSEDSDDTLEFIVNPDYIELENVVKSIVSSAEYGNPSAKCTVPVSLDFYNRFVPESHARLDENNLVVATLEKELEDLKKQVEPFSKERVMAMSKDDPNVKVFAKIALDLMEKIKSKNTELLRVIEQRQQVFTSDIDEMHDNGMARAGLTILCTLYYFQLRTPKEYVTTTENDSSGYHKHNDMYNLLKKLQPPVIVRPKNGTLSWFKQQRVRHTESWHVKGHSRTFVADRYKNMKGKTVWVDPFIKGTGENMRLSIYVDKMGSEIVAEEKE